MIKEIINRIVCDLSIARLERKLATGAGRLQAAVNNLVDESGQKVSSIRRVRFGGVNNNGMFVGYSASAPVLLIKLQPTILAEREIAFMHWQSRNRLNLTPDVFSHFSLTDAAVTATCSRFLATPSHYEAAKVHALHQRLTSASQYRSDLATDTELQDAIEADTPIKKVLSGLVIKKPEEDISVWLKQFLRERKQRFADDKLFNSVSEFFYSVAVSWSQLASPLSLVHGDFKRQNILMDDAGQYQLIDLQYYTAGQPLWDLAFYYSKYDDGFAAAMRDYEQNKEVGADSDVLFIFFYLVAVLINIKPKRWKRAAESKVIPALARIKALDGGQ